MAGLTERQLVLLLRERFRTTSGALELGIGDDAAILAGQDAAWACSVDASVQGVHFDLTYLSLEDVGYRAFQAAVSDLAAMGAEPVAALSALILPRALSRDDIDHLTRGQAQASVDTQCPIVGGNIARGHELSITTTVLGSCDRPLRRDGARAGEQLWVIGPLGLAAAGLSCLRLGLDGKSPAERPVPARTISERRDGWSSRQMASIAQCVSAWRRPRAQLIRGRALRQLASAGIDVSDGLAADARQLALASGVRIVIEEARLRAALEPCLVSTSRALRRSALHFALYGGEEYALLATGRSADRPVWATPIGYVTRGAGVMLAARGQRRPLRGGFDHMVT
jgi:thiamine-monophosphate kinase